MSGIGALVVIFWIIRLIASASSSFASTPPKPDAKQQNSDGFIVVVVWLLGAPITLGTAFAATRGSLIGLVIAALGSLVLFPWFMVRRLAVPLGLPGVASALVRLARVFWRSEDQYAGRATAAGLALLRQKIPDSKALSNAEGQVALAGPLRGSTVVAEGILALVHGRRDDARSLFESALHFDARTTTTTSERLAREWLAADAASRGDWRSVIRVGGAGRTSRATDLLAALGRRLTAEAGAPNDLGLWLRWFVAPARRRTISIVRKAIEVPPPVPRPRVPDLASRKAIPATTLGEAMGRTVQLLRRTPGQLTAEEVADTAASWDAVLARPEVGEVLLRTVARNEARGVTDPVGALRRGLSEDLARLIRANALPVPVAAEPGELLTRTIRTVRDALLEEVELAADRLERRTQDERALPPLEELREFRAIAGLYSSAVRRGGLDVQRMLFARVNLVVCAQAVWLYNERNEKPLGNTIFRWLLAEATALNDESALKLATKNAACPI